MMAWHTGSEAYQELPGDNAKFDPAFPGPRIVLAMTCWSCGLLKGGGEFPRNTSGIWSTCKSCTQEQKKRRNVATKRTATRAFRKWTGEEVRAIKDRSKTARQLAVELGRSEFSVKTARAKFINGKEN